MRDKIQETISGALPAARVVVASEDDTHFSAVVVSPDFEGLSRVRQHQMVMNALKAEFDTERLHALQLRTFTPEKWEAAQATGPLQVVQE
ncbi:MAG: BolA family transcriptional regulator [Acidobacteriota bacterium]|nr:BolA family transcriptional regulator [Acidobacteriota bacterium]